MRVDSPNPSTVPVMLPMPAERPYSYGVPDGMAVSAGSIVRVPLGPREVAGIVWDGAADEVDPVRLRPISRAFDCPPIDADTRRFVDWVAAYTLSPPGMVARMLLRAPGAFDPEPWTEGLQRGPVQPDRTTAARRRVLDIVDGGPAWTRSGLAHAAGVSSSVIDGLRAQGVLATVMLPPRPVVAEPDPAFGRPDLSTDQSEAAEILCQASTRSAASVAR